MKKFSAIWMVWMAILTVSASLNSQTKPGIVSKITIPGSLIGAHDSKTNSVYYLKALSVYQRIVNGEVVSAFGHTSLSENCGLSRPPEINFVLTENPPATELVEQKRARGFTPMTVSKALQTIESDQIAGKLVLRQLFGVLVYQCGGTPAPFTAIALWINETSTTYAVTRTPITATEFKNMK